ncbi:DUF488 domain-containing protein [Methanoregula formicica]|uniref:DUF488 domain-containing protein n=1 Tax=Methanoregula formicica (strain DSM 22288 / NBRC 105244 / SMSP) TaxID=593750 RepID=L0HGB7_METFS|nr:DUF488 domain-containing protein [Methanoregula formicica]AGB03772.1 hypothetical protein Metfor_2789 [Methanoregula formicica SMSP]
MIRVKRVYDPPQSEDGFRVLVERLWPRGMTREMAHLDLWLKEIAPSTSLRKWFAHDPVKWEGFKKRYEGELSEKHDLVSSLTRKSRTIPVTLLFSAHDVQHNSAVVLKGVLEKQP